MKRIVGLLLLWATGMSAVCAQKAVLKTNLLHDATASVHIGLELGLAPRWTIDVSGALNLWNIEAVKKWRHWMIQPEARYWFCDRFNGHFFGLHLLGGPYNIGGTKLLFNAFPQTQSRRFEGWAVGAGIAYGYQWILSRRWSIEATVGLGYLYSEYEKYPCATCGKKIDQGRKHYFGPTKAAISVLYILK